ncbi:MAG: hypothetical protein ACYC64_06925 [Armatimonadota bacterium]
MNQTTQTITKSEQRLLQIIQKLHNGKIEEMAVIDGEPIIDQTTKLVQRVYFVHGAVKRPVLVDHCYHDKHQVVDMLQNIREFCNGVVACLEIRDGLPYEMTTIETALD